MCLGTKITCLVSICGKNGNGYLEVMKIRDSFGDIDLLELTVGLN